METLDNGKQGRRSPWALVERMVRSTWMVPLLCLAVNLLCVAAITWMGLGRTALIACLCVIALSFLALLLWFNASLFFKQSWGSRVLRLLLVGGVGGVYFCNGGGAQYWHVPEGVDFEVPAGLSVDEDAPDIVQRLADRTSEHGASEPPSTLPEGDFPTRAENLEKLAQQHPDLLREFVFRAKLLNEPGCIHSEACTDQPGSANMQTCFVRLLCAGMPPSDWRRDPFERSGNATADAVEELGNGWTLASYVRKGYDVGGDKAENERLRGYAIQRFDALFAKLAQNPAMETIDSLLPLPQTPRLQLAESSSRGIYHLTLWLPKDARRDGHYQIRAFEYNTGTKLGIDGFHSKDVIVLEHALVMMQPDFAVYTGDWGQYYGSRWQVWFVPNRGEKELVCEQLFLMQGWTR